MSNIKIVYVNDSNIFTINNLKQTQFAKKYHALGIHYLIKRMTLKYDIFTSDEAIKNLEEKKWSPKETLLIQEMSSKKGDKLIKLGAIPFIWICFEGPFIGHRLYDNIRYYAQQFYKIIIYDDKYPGLERYKNKILNIGFPCVENNNNNTFIPYSIDQWKSKKTIVGIWSNKHYSLNLKKITYHTKNRNYKYILGEIISKLTSKTYKKNLNYQLIDKRIETFLNLSKLTKFDLYGRGWGNSYETPKKILDKIFYYSSNIFDGNNAKYKEVTKKEIYNQYKFSLCFENSISRSYITEKIFDCFFEKIIPIYYGAPNIDSFIPKECFIDYRNFKNDKDLFYYLNNINYEKANEYLQAAHNFINSKEILKYSCLIFSDLIVNETDKYIEGNIAS